MNLRGSKFEVVYRGGGGEQLDGYTIYFVRGDAEVQIRVNGTEFSSAKEAVLSLGLTNGIDTGGLYLIDVVRRWKLDKEMKKLLDEGIDLKEALRRIYEELGKTAEKHKDLLRQVKLIGDYDVAYVIAKELDEKTVEFVIYLGFRVGNRLYEYEPIFARFVNGKLDMLSIREHYMPYRMDIVNPLLAPSIFIARDPFIDRNNRFLVPVALSVGKPLDLDKVKFGVPAEQPMKNSVGNIVDLPKIELLQYAKHNLLI